MPPIPELADEALEGWTAAHDRSAAAVGALSDPLGLTLRRWLIGHLVVALAGRSPSVSGIDAAPMLPAPRAFLSPTDRIRIDGTAAALTHVEIRVHLATTGIEPSVLRPETPYVLHALAESGQTGTEETNPGVLRTKVAAWLETVSPYVHPPADLVRGIVDELIDTAATAAAPSPAVAAWAAFTWMSAHPWVDGNGRTARLLYLLLTGPDLALELDYGVIEQFTFRRREYVDALQRGQHVTPVYDPNRLDPAPFVEAATAWSTIGAEATAARAAVLGRADEALAASRPDLDEIERALALWVALERHAPASAFASAIGQTDPVLVTPHESLERLCAQGVLGRRPLPPSRARGGAGGIGYVAGDVVVGALGRALVAPTGVGATPGDLRS